MPLVVSAAVARRASELGCGLRLELRPGPMTQRPLPLDLFFEESAPPDHAEFVVGSVKVWIPLPLTWIADQDAMIEAAADGHVHGAIEDVRLPY